ncbi:halogenase [Rhodopirellula islandica]|uniref:Halogenase n=1 Tax=Rhodopirellula islandica TaxID=595434 RepID=A0A0J1B4N3_RHOIS|nr:FAD-dependent oxidoreductase [Rhodopirellula islandica]KLU01573.1 halogenase [Rhodopirellula islandica]
MSDSPANYDVAILGGGFSGGLLAWVLASRGVRVLLIERERFGRFAIGESSTPMADLVLRQLADQYGMPELRALSTYPTWKDAFPNLRCGKKRGFSYYHHGDASSPSDAGREFHDRNETLENDCGNSLLVTASPSDTWSDTQWLRSDLDSFFIERAVRAGADCRERTEVVDATLGEPIQLTLCDRSGDRTSGKTQSLSAQWLVNASGRFGVLPDSLSQSIGVRRVDERLQTSTRSVFAHFRGVGSWTEELRRTSQLREDEPFDPDDAAQHHLTTEGWMWMLRMDHGVTSVGWTQPTGASSGEVVSGTRDSTSWRRYPSLQTLMRGATFCEATPHWISVDRVQRMQLPVRNRNYVTMPTAVATIDPLHSTGIAHGLIGVARLADALLSESSRRRELLDRYATTVEREVLQIDALVSMCYQSLSTMSRFEAVSMLYFASAIASEEFLASGGNVHSTLWLCDDEPFCQLIAATQCQLANDVLDAELWRWLQPRLQPFQNAGLLDPRVRGRYRYTGEAKR